MCVTLANEMLCLFKAVQKVEHDLFRGTQVLILPLLAWVAKTSLEAQAVEQMMGQLASLLSELASEEMQESLDELLGDFGLLFATLVRDPNLRVLVEASLSALFDDAAV